MSGVLLRVAGCELRGAGYDHLISLSHTLSTSVMDSLGRVLLEHEMKLEVRRLHTVPPTLSPRVNGLDNGKYPTYSSARHATISI